MQTAITATEFVEKYPHFFNTPLEERGLFDRVTKQAIQHTKECSNNDAVDALRPFEMEAVRDYRKANRAHITNEGVESFRSETSTIIKDSGANFTDVSDELQDFLDSKPFSVGGLSVGVSEYLYDEYYPTAIEDPNAIAIAFPYQKDRPNTPPANAFENGGLPENKRADIDVKIIESKDLVSFKQILAFKADGQWEITINNNKALKDYYYIADADFWYRYVPTGIDNEKGGMKYELQPWYWHRTGRLPYVILPGDPTSCETSSKLKYKKSYLKILFEYGDMFNGRLSDSIAGWTNLVFPIMAMKEIPCNNSECKNGKVFELAEDGRTRIGSHTCKTCGGTQKMPNISPFEIISIPDNSGNFEKGDNRDMVQFYSANKDSVELILNHPWSIWKMGKKSVGLDVLESLSESGVAKDLRLKPLYSMLNKVGFGLLKTFEELLWLCECVLKPRIDQESQRQRPRAIIPKEWKVKSVEMLQEEARNSLPVDRLRSTVDFVKSKYSEDPKTQKVNEFALYYAPLLQFNLDECQKKINSQAYGDLDVLKADNAVMALNDICEEIGFDKFKTLSKQEIIERVDEYLIELGRIPKPVELFDGQPDIPADRSKLLDTVGGIQAMVEVNKGVAEGSITETAGENILIEFFQISREKASTLIDVPDKSAIPEVEPKPIVQPVTE